jgi:hypothetical protein
MLGFAAAWVATTGAGAVVVAAFMTRAQPPPMLPALPLETAAVAAAVQCPKSWEPPLVAVNDLPVAMDDVHAITPPAGVWKTRPLAAAAPVAPAAPAPVAVVQHAAPRPVAATLAQKVDPAPAMRPTRAKTTSAPPAGPPHSLEDWIRRAVATDTKR